MDGGCTPSGWRCHEAARFAASAVETGPEAANKANASKSADLGNAKGARGAKGTQTPIRTADRAPTLNRCFSMGLGSVFGDVQTGAKPWNRSLALAPLAPPAPFALKGCLIWADFGDF